MSLPTNLETPIPFCLGAAVDPVDIVVRGYGPGGDVCADTAAGTRITVMGDGVYQYITGSSELAYPGLYLYVFDNPNGSDLVRFEVA